MIILDNTNKSLVISLGANVTDRQLPFTCTVVDLGATAFTPLTNDGLSNNTGNVTISAAPPAGLYRQLKFLSIYNTDSASATVNILLADGSSTYQIFSANIASGFKLIYAQDEFAVYDTNGAKQGTGTAGATGPAGAPGTDYWLYVTNN